MKRKKGETVFWSDVVLSVKEWGTQIHVKGGENKVSNAFGCAVGEEAFQHHPTVKLGYYGVFRRMMKLSS